MEEKVVPFEFESAEALLEYFWQAVDKVIGARGASK